MGNVLSNFLILASLMLVALVGYDTWKEAELKDKFDVLCRDSGGIPLRATYHYDPKTNKIHYVCLKQTSVMDVE